MNLHEFMRSYEAKNNIKEKSNQPVRIDFECVLIIFWAKSAS